MALCDQLEAQLTTTEADSRRLLEAVLHEALNPLAEVTEQLESVVGRTNAQQKLTRYMQRMSHDPSESFSRTYSDVLRARMHANNIPNRAISFLFLCR